MRSEEKKLILLRFLGEEPVDLSLPCILNRLGPDFKERTVRRWLSKMAGDGIVDKSGVNRGAKYRLHKKNIQKFETERKNEPHNKVKSNSKVRTLKVNVYRVRYRQQRKAILRIVIEETLVGSRLLDYIEAKSKKDIPYADQEAFKREVMTDLELLDESRVAGLGITPDQIKAWFDASNNS
ncbi:hypothetical protein COB11_05125 [Candidatus Aerophobetes bacterium]|uniref:Uncharacterized protein n=1 Tax=Aerophobetes bacterium TaxID=2030807 RepID=A0A2A4YGS6_UNCAE|nr:MAG: hypothetical protein COB11_05125 [Candidatus Aerophobetes bacterium]